MRSYGLATRFDHRQPEVSKFFQSEGSHFRAESELNNGIHVIQMDERHGHRMALQLVDHRSLILSDRIRIMSQQDHRRAALLSVQCRLFESMHDSSGVSLWRMQEQHKFRKVSRQKTGAFPRESSASYSVAPEGNETRATA